MGTLFAIGGGEISRLETLAIDEAIVKASGKSNPKLLFIPTASNDHPGYIQTIQNVYGKQLGCVVDVLQLIDNDKQHEDLQRQIMDADIIYVGGGNTQKLLDVIKQFQLEDTIKKSYQNGTILSGVSAGSLCWFRLGSSETTDYNTSEQSMYKIIEGLNFIDAMHCPHYNEVDAHIDFDQKIIKNDSIGIGIEDHCAIEFKDNMYKVHKSKPHAKAFKVYKHNNDIIREELVNTSDYTLIDSLLKK